jgi:hypothetical protein
MQLVPRAVGPARRRLSRAESGAQAGPLVEMFYPQNGNPAVGPTVSRWGWQPVGVWGVALVYYARRRLRAEVVGPSRAAKFSCLASTSQWSAGRIETRTAFRSAGTAEPRCPGGRSNQKHVCNRGLGKVASVAHVAWMVVPSRVPKRPSPVYGGSAEGTVGSRRQALFRVSRSLR